MLLFPAQLPIVPLHFTMSLFLSLPLYNFFLASTRYTRFRLTLPLNALNLQCFNKIETLSKRGHQKMQYFRTLTLLCAMPIDNRHIFLLYV